MLLNTHCVNFLFNPIKFKKMGQINAYNHTTRVEAVIEKIETVLKKSRESLLDEEVHLLEESLAELKEINFSNQNQTTFSANDLVSIGKIIIQLLRFFDIEIP